MASQEREDAAIDALIVLALGNKPGDEEKVLAMLAEEEADFAAKTDAELDAIGRPIMAAALAEGREILAEARSIESAAWDHAKAIERVHGSRSPEADRAIGLAMWMQALVATLKGWLPGGEG